MLYQGGNEIRAAVYDDVLSRLALELLHRANQVAALDADVLTVHPLNCFAEYNLGDTNHLLGKRKLWALRLVDHALPVIDESLSHLAAEQDRIAAVGQLVDEPKKGRVHVEGHPIEATPLS